MDSSQKFRSRIILVLIACGAAALVLALGKIQIINGQTYTAKANSQYIRPQKNIFDRGSIYFTDKDGTKVAAASLKSGYIVYMNPSLLDKPSSVYEALSEYLDLDKTDVLAKATKRGDQYEELASRVPEATALSIKSLNIAGVGVNKETWRVYPGGSIAAHELGLVGEDATTKTVSGRYGLERTYNSVLDRLGTGSSVNAFAQLFIGLKDSLFGQSRANEGDVVTTIEPTVERYLEKILKETSGTWKPDEIGGIIIDPKTGEIVAMSSWPSFDPNNTASVKDARAFSDPLIENVYEMGSIMKPLTMATALDTGAEKVDSTYDDTGTMTLSGKKISNFDGKARGIIPMQEILSQSLNVGAATIALKVGKNDFSKYFLNFGLGDKTGIDLPNEATGIVNNLKTGRDVEIATAAYGQGLAISPINMTRALSVLANGGYVLTPHLGKRIEYADGRSEPVVPKLGKSVLSTQTVNEVTDMLVKVVDEALLKGAIKMDRYRIAAKTGTAQIPDHVKGGYYSDRYLHSFFGYFPAHDPKFLVFLYQVYPKGAEYASATLTSPFQQITKFLIDYYNIPPDR
ncbi:MAG: penicillin-binding protein 2 [Candidatus Paceibacterota bacterium]